MSIPELKVNNITPAGDSLHMDVEELKIGMEQMYNKTRMAQYNKVEDIGLTRATATFELIRKKLAFNSELTLTMAGGNHPLLDSPATLTGGFMSGTMRILGNNTADGRVIAWFYNESGVYYRYWNNAYPVGNVLRDTGWMLFDNFGQSRQLGSGEATWLGGKLLNIKLPGNYFIAGGTLNSNFTDTPFPANGAAASNLEVRAAQNDRGLTFVLRVNNGLVSEWRNFVPYGGSGGTWRPVMVGGTTFNADITCQHLTPRQASTYNLGSLTVGFANAFLHNAPTIISDRRQKQDFLDITDEALDAMAEVDFTSWKSIVDVEELGEKAKRNFGIIAQELRDAFIKHGLDAEAYGVLWHNTSTTGGEPIYDEEGRDTGYLTRVIQHDNYMVRMEQILALEAAAMRRATKRLEARITALEAVK